MIKNFWNRLIEARATRASYNTLEKMTDRELQDIGVTRAEIKYRVFK